jgi:hypothetical protein
MLKTLYCQRIIFKNLFPFTTALARMEILNRAVCRLKKEHYNSRIGPLDPLVLEIYLAKTTCIYAQDMKSRDVYASYFNLSNSKALFSKVIVGSTISEDKTIAEKKFMSLFKTLERKAKQGIPLVEIKNLENCSLCFAPEKIF